MIYSIEGSKFLITRNLIRLNDERIRCDSYVNDGVTMCDSPLYPGLYMGAEAMHIWKELIDEN